MESVPSNYQQQPMTPHDIFLSHSGKQKGFVKDLYSVLITRSFTTFLDIKHHSLPVGENFPQRILHAATRCKLALVVLSHDFVCSKWPMLELSTFVEAGVKIMPLFYKLSPSDLKNKDKLNTWRNAWEDHAKVDRRILVSKWDDALRRLSSQNGLTFDAATEGELSYIERIVYGICVSQFVTPATQHDTCHIRGKDRICKIILNKLEQMESCKQDVVLQHADLALPPSPSRFQAAQSSATCVLGVYGLPGSGKSTMCKCLRDHFFPIYGGKSLYLELPMNPSQADLVQKFKELLHLTDFRDRLNLDNGVTDLEQVEYLLKKHQLSSCRVFLVIDNISENSIGDVQSILQVGVAPGSKVILVACTGDILRPALNSQGNIPFCICDSMGIPEINEKEATEILLQTTRAGTMASDGYKLEQRLTPKQADIVLRTVQMCGFGEENSQKVYLPLIMKIMGALLIKYHGGFERWGSDQERFWTKVKIHKEDAVKKLVEESFKALCTELQLLFLDVALFILPSKLGDIHEVLSFMHGTSVPQMEIMVKNLEWLCFLTVSYIERVREYRVYVHDVYLEFAKSLQEGSMSWCWWNLNYSDAEMPRALVLNREGEQKQVRTMILELGEGWDKVDLQSFSGLKALAIRHCKSLVALGVAGLSSLVSLDIENCASLQQVECRDSNYISLLNVKRLRIQKEDNNSYTSPLHVKGPIRGQKRRTECNDVSLLDVNRARMGEIGRVLLPSLRQFMNVLQRMVAPAEQPKSFQVAGIAQHMRGLQVLRLENTGIRSFIDMSSCWLQLQDLTVIESCLEEFEVGSLPHLRRFHFNDHGLASEYPHPPDQTVHYMSLVNEKINSPRFNVQGRDLLLGCSNLEQVEMFCSFFKKGELGSLPPNLKVLDLNFFYNATELPDLVSSAHTLEKLTLMRFEKLERVDLMVGFRNLRYLELKQCASLVEVIIGLDSLPSLQELHVVGCPKLWTLIGFDNSRMLESLCVQFCPELQEISCLSGLTSLETVNLLHSYPILGNADIENLRNLTSLVCSRFREPISLRKLGNLVKLQLWYKNDISLKSGIGEAAPYSDFASLVGLEHADAENPTRCLPSIDSLLLSEVNDLAGMDGIEHLLTLTVLDLRSLNFLRRVQGIEYLIHLRSLYIQDCPLLEEMPSLHALVSVQTVNIENCRKLKAVEGCSEMKGLICARFDGCKSMARLPFNDQLDGVKDLVELTFAGCKFAKDIEAMVAWVVDVEALTPLRLASVHQLAWEYYDNCPGAVEKESWLEAVFRRLLDGFLPNDDDCIDFGQWRNWNRIDTLRALMEELQRRLERKPKKELLQNFQVYKHALLDFLDDVHVAGLCSDYDSIETYIFNL